MATSRLDHTIRSMASVQYLDSFLLVGGENYETSVLEYKPEEERFVALPGVTLSLGRQYHGAVLVDEEVYCG